MLGVIAGYASSKHMNVTGGLVNSEATGGCPLRSGTFLEMQTHRKRRCVSVKTPGEETDGREHMALTLSHGHARKPARASRESLRVGAGDVPRRGPPPASESVFRPCCWASLMKVALSARSLVALVHITKSLYIM